jgi:hypothetical protein
MKETIKKTVVFLIIISMVLIIPGTAAMAAEKIQLTEPSAGKMIVDIAVIRPIGIISTVIGVAVFLVSSPFSATGGNQELAKEKLINEPAKHTFRRALGDF